MSVPLDQPVRLTFNTYSDPADTVPADPTAITLDILDPAGVTTTHNWTGDIVRDALGVFHFDVTPAVSGHYAYHWKATGTVATALDGSFDVEPKYGYAIVSQDTFALYLNNDAVKTDPRARFILDKAQQLCETIVNPLPTGADIVVLDVAERAYANPTSTSGSSLALYSEGEGPFAAGANGTVGGGLWLQDNNVKTLRRLAGQSGGAFTIDTLPATYAPSVPWWDTGVTIGGDWDTPP